MIKAWCRFSEVGGKGQCWRLLEYDFAVGLICSRLPPTQGELEFFTLIFIATTTNLVEIVYIFDISSDHDSMKFKHTCLHIILKQFKLIMFASLPVLVLHISSMCSISNLWQPQQRSGVQYHFVLKMLLLFPHLKTLCNAAWLVDDTLTTLMHTLQCTV